MFGLHLGNVAVEGVDRIDLELLLCRLVILDIRPAADDFAGLADGPRGVVRRRAELDAEPAHPVVDLLMERGSSLVTHR